MKKSIHETLTEIDPAIIEKARNAYAARKHLEQFRNKNTGKINYREAYGYFASNFPHDISFCRQEKKSGYNCLAVFRGVEIVGIADFMTEEGKRIKQSHREIETFNVYSLEKFHREIAKKYFSDIWDNRCKTPTCKPSVARFIDEVTPLIIN